MSDNAQAQLRILVSRRSIADLVHRVYWSEWIGRHHRQRRKLLTKTGMAATVGLVALGFTSVYREGFEVVLFLQNLELQSGSGTVLEGVAIGLAATAVRASPIATPSRTVPEPLCSCRFWRNRTTSKPSR